MSRLAKLKGNTNGKEKIKTEQTPPTAETRKTPEKKSGSRLGKTATQKSSRISGNKPKSEPYVPSERQIEKETQKDVKVVKQQFSPDLDETTVTKETQPRKSRLATMGITRAEAPRPVPMDEEIEQFQKDLDTIEKMAMAKAPELRQGISSIITRMQTREHLADYLYENPAELRKALIGFRAQFSKRHGETTARAKKKAQKATEVNDFLKDAGL